ncbi:MAG: F0F1 ATP synthase subunit epsilon [Chlorobi bacterium CHB2]|nr:F0F1 ATP synthase subunit epsilon [Chlorobi bacterium CHB2]
MAEKKFQVEIVTPRRTVFQGEATLIALPGVVGPFQVLIHHAPLLTALEVGNIRIVSPEGKEEHFATSGGFVEVRNNVVTVIAETVEPSAEIDIERARRARDRAEQRIVQARTTPGSGIDTARAHAALARSINRLKTVGI